MRFPLRKRGAKRCIVAFAGLLCAGTAQAEPYMAVREGAACADCHTNRTGGGMRSLLVEMHAGDVLHLPRDGQGLFPAVDERFSPQLTDWLRVGSDFRLVDELVFQDDPDENGRVDNNTAFRRLDTNDIDVEQATLYGSITLIPDYLSFYVDERFAPGGASNREAFGIIDGLLPGRTYVKGGRFFPAWGLKLQDDEAFVSAQSGLNFDRTLSGVEVGRGGKGLNWFLTLADGSGDDTDPLLMASAFYAGDRLLAGGSFAYSAPDDDEISAATAFAGVPMGPFVLLGQGVYVMREVDGDSTDSWIAYGELDWLLFGIVNMKVAFDYMDPDTDTSEDARNRVSVGFEPFLDEFFQLRAFYRVLNGPEDQPDANRDLLTVEAHLFF